MINSLASLQQYLANLDQSGVVYWHILHRLLPLVQQTRKYTHQKEIAPYLNIHPAKLSSFITMTKHFTPLPLSKLEDIAQGSIHLNTIDIDALLEDIDNKWGNN